MDYEDFRNVRNYVKSKVGLLRGDSFHQDQASREVIREPDGLLVPAQRVEEFKPPSNRPTALETSHISDVLEVKDLKKLDDFKLSILNEALQFLQSISVDGVNGHRVGTILVIGKTNDLKKHSTGEIPNPLQGHDRDDRSIFKGDFKNSLAQFSQFDGFTGMDWDGCVEFCGRLIEVPHDLGKVPDEILGHGARHKAGWAITKLVPNCISLVLSQDGEVLVIKNGNILKIVRMMDGVKPFYTKKYPPPLETYFDTQQNTGSGEEQSGCTASNAAAAAPGGKN